MSSNAAQHSQINVIKRDGSGQPIDYEKIITTIKRYTSEYENDVSVEVILEEFKRNIFDGISTSDLEKALLYSIIALIERDPAYNKIAASIFLQRLYKEVIQLSISDDTLDTWYRKKFIEGIQRGITVGRLSPALLTLPLDKLAEELVIDRDKLFGYMGIHTLYERYFLKDQNGVYELPQAFWMRVAMGLSLKESADQQLARIKEFYEVLSTFNYISGTPTLFHSGLVRSQLSSCYLTYIDDDLNHIFKCLRDNANLSKYSGGIGNDWTPLRATGAMIKTINAPSQGVIPFLKIANDVVSAINRSGNRRGATAAYLETWHYDIEDFLDLRRNTGDERRRTHDINTANWIPDLFMKRVINKQDWTLFSPHETPDLHDLYGKAFETRYEEYEEMARQGKINLFKVIPAEQLWRKMLSRLFETGHPWITFKDACNVRSPQDHCGVVHSSNLCTEITLNTSPEETAVCNLGSINLGQHIINGSLDEAKLARTIATAVRMLDNTIDNNFYPTVEAERSNLKHRALGLGVMGLQDALFKLDLAFDDPQVLHLADELMEKISYHAFMASSQLAKERGAYQSYKGSKWDRGLLPFDTVDLYEQERGVNIAVNRNSKLDWTPVREHIKHYGMRNSNVLAIAPTATISNIVGCFPSIEPIYKNLYVKTNLSGEFTIVNEYLVNDLKKLGLWDQNMLDAIKYYDGSIQMIDEIPDKLKRKYQEAFELDPEWLIQLTAVRSKWIDQSQSHNVFMRGDSGKKLNDIYMTAWKYGVKTLYYLRTLGASQIEKVTIDAKKFGYTQKRTYQKIAMSPQEAQEKAKQACSIYNSEECTSCQ